jgi:hypothetical protein
MQTERTDSDSVPEGRKRSGMDAGLCGHAVLGEPLPFIRWISPAVLLRPLGYAKNGTQEKQLPPTD